MYKVFGSLGARNILYLEAELKLLEFHLHELDETDKQVLLQPRDSLQRHLAEKAARSWEDLREIAAEGDERQTKKLRIIFRLRRLMKEYEKALLRRNKVLALEKPASGPFKALKGWYGDVKPLWGSSHHILDQEEDMIALGSQDEPDRISSIIYRYFGYYLRKRRQTPKSWGRMYYYPVERVSNIVLVLSVLMVVILLVGAIVALHFVKPVGVLLAIIGIFTVAFAVSISLLTNARRAEVFGATAAYAAVLVVFISFND